MGCTPHFSPVLSLLPPFILSIHDLLALTATSRAVREVILENLTPHSLLAIVSRSPDAFGSEHDWHLFSILAPGVSKWIALSQGNTLAFRLACMEAPRSLIDLCLRHRDIACLAAFDLLALRNAHERRYTVINPLTDLIDRCVGDQWYATPDFWNGGAEDAVTLYSEPHKAVYQMIVYGELFGGAWEDFGLSIEACVSRMADNQQTVVGQTAKGEESSGTEWDLQRACELNTRVEYIKYAIPDVSTGYYIRHNEWVQIELPNTLDRQSSDSTIHPLRRVTEAGPFSKGKFTRTEDISSLLHLLRRSPLWRDVADTVRTRITLSVDRDGAGGPQLSEFRQHLWTDALWTMGWDSARLMAEEWRWHHGNPYGTSTQSVGRTVGHGKAEMSRDGLDVSRALLRLEKRRRVLCIAERVPESIELIGQSRIRTSTVSTCCLPVLVTDLLVAIFVL